MTWKSIRAPRLRRAQLLLERVRSGIDGLITTLRDRIDAEVLEAGKGTLKGIAQLAVGVDNISRADANRCGIPFTNTADVLTDATAEFAFAILLAVSRKLWPSERLVRENRWGLLASVSALPGRRGHGQDDCGDRMRTHRPGDDRQVLRL